MPEKVFDITREQAIKIICSLTDKDDPFWERLVDDFYDEETDSMPTLYDVLKPLGVTKIELGINEGSLEPTQQSKSASTYREYLEWVIAAADRAVRATGHEHHKGALKAYKNALKKLDRYSISLNSEQTGDCNKSPG